MNPCPCGWLGAFAATGKSCRCTPDVVVRCQGRLSGPLLDRIEMQVEVPAISPTELLAAADGEPSATVAARVQVARERQLGRQAGATNAALSSARSPLRHGARRHHLPAARRHAPWSGRSLHRVMKLARTIADLAGADTVAVAVAHVAEAIQYRRALPQA